MKLLHTSIFITNFLFCLVCFGQNEEPKKLTARDTLPPAEKYGLRVGVDLAKVIRTIDDDDYEGFEIVGDYRIYKDYYITLELGTESLLRDEENVSVKGSGSYARIGVDWNTYDNWYGMQNSIYVGLRYGFSTFNQELENYRIFSNTSYYEPDVRFSRQEESGLTAGWVELVLGLEVELFHNIYLGANVSIRNLISEQNPERFDNLFIPGYGRTNDYSTFGVGYAYTISYLIPFYKKKR
ncbi:DUF6048 family protein [Aquimarina brevivitae]|uniref:Outer membrane protein with beta-barrel domain n=1 Tax=Aquimarina brevivitae TaxID=323412 RepID=A0A4Q7NU35_9FLAO|nr:DUF6048 family protein [Aquimarina brevivitae]RZS90430.1 hypothetical protein EV197_3415 [Aquimarina brevivitae]